MVHLWKNRKSKKGQAIGGALADRRGEERGGEGLSQLLIEVMSNEHGLLSILFLWQENTTLYYLNAIYFASLATFDKLKKKFSRKRHVAGVKFLLNPSNFSAWFFLYFLHFLHVLYGNCELWFGQDSSSSSVFIEL
jgi:hypothetical protein